MDFHAMKRRELQDLCKKHGIPANNKNVEMADKLVSIFKEKEKPVPIGKSCLKNVVDLADEDGSKDESRKAKKVRFSPRDELVEYDLEDQSDPRNVRVKARAMRKMAMSKPVLNEDQVRSTRSHMCKSIAADVVIDLSFPPVKKRLISSGKSTDSGFEDDNNNIKAGDEKQIITGPRDENLAGQCKSLGNGQTKKRSIRTVSKSNDLEVINGTSGPVGFPRTLTRSRKKSEEEVVPYLEGVNQRSTRSHMRKSIAADVVIDLSFPLVKKRLRSSGKNTDSGLEDDIKNLKAADEKQIITGSCDENLAGKCESLGNGQIKKRYTRTVSKSNESEVISGTSGPVGFARTLTRSRKKNEEEVLHLEEPKSKRGGRKGVNQKSVGTANAKVIIGENTKKLDDKMPEIEAHTKLANENEKDGLPTRRSRRNTSMFTSSTAFVEESNEFVGRKKPLEQVKESLPCEQISETVGFKRKSTRAKRDLSAVCKEPDKIVNANRKNGTRKSKMNTVMEEETQETVANAKLLDKDVVETIPENLAVEPVSEVEEIKDQVLKLTEEDNSSSEKMSLRSGRKSNSKKQNGSKLHLFSDRDTVVAADKDTVLRENIETVLTPQVEVIHVPLLNHFKEGDIGIEKMRLRSDTKSSSKKQNGTKLQLSSHRDTVAAPDKDIVLMENIETEPISEAEEIHFPLLNHFTEDAIGSEKMRLRSSSKSTSKNKISDKLQFSISDTVIASEKDSVSMDKEKEILPPHCDDEGDDDQVCQSQQGKEDVDQIGLDKQEQGEDEMLEDSSPVNDSSALRGLDSLGKPVLNLRLGEKVEGEEDSFAVKQTHSVIELHDCYDDDDGSVHREENLAEFKEGTGTLSEPVHEYQLEEGNESEGPAKNCENVPGDAETMLNSSDKIGTPLMSPEGVNNEAGSEKNLSDCQASVGGVLSEMFSEIEINTPMHLGKKMEIRGDSSIDFEECHDYDQYNDSNDGIGSLPELSVEKYCKKASEASPEALYDSNRTETPGMSSERVANEEYCSEGAADFQAMVSSSHASSCRIDTPLNAILDNEQKGMSGHSVTAYASRHAVVIDNDTQQQEENQMKIDTTDKSTIRERSSKLNVEDLECLTYDSQSPNVTMCNEEIFGGNSESAINFEERTGDVMIEEINKHVEAAAELPAPHPDGEEGDPLSGQFSLKDTATPTSCNTKEDSSNHEINIFGKIVPDGEALSGMIGSPCFQETLAEDDKKHGSSTEKTPPINVSHISDSDDYFAGKSGIRIMDTEGGLYSVLDDSKVVDDAEDIGSDFLSTNHETKSTKGFHDGYQSMSSFKNTPSMLDHVNGQESAEAFVRASDTILSENKVASSDQTTFEVVDESTFEDINKDDDAEEDIAKSTSNEKILIEGVEGSLPQSDPNCFASGNVIENEKASSLLDEVIGHYFYEDGTAERKEKYKTAFGSVGNKSLPDAMTSASNDPYFGSMNANDHDVKDVVSNGSEDFVRETASRNLNVPYEYKTEDEGFKRDCDIELCDNAVKERNAEIFSEAELTNVDNFHNVVAQITGSPLLNSEATIFEELKKFEEKTTVEMIQNTSPDFEKANSSLNAHEASCDALCSKASVYASADYASESSVEVSLFETKECTNLLADIEKETIQQIDELMSVDISDHEMDQDSNQSYFDKGDLNLVEESYVAVEIDVTVKEIDIVDGNDSEYVSAENVGTLQQVIEANYGCLENKDEGLVILAEESTFNISHTEYGESVKGEFLAETNESYFDSKNEGPVTEKVENVADMNYDDCAASVDDIHDSVDRVDDKTMNERGDYELFVDASSDLGTNNVTASDPTASSINDDNTSIQNDNEATLEYSMVAKAVDVGSANKLRDSDTQLTFSENSSDVLAPEPESISQVESHLFTSREMDLILEDFEQYAVKEINQSEALISMTESSTTQNIVADNLLKDHQMEEKVSQLHDTESISEQAASKENVSDEPITEHALENEAVISIEQFLSADNTKQFVADENSFDHVHNGTDSDEPTTADIIGVDAQNTQIAEQDLDLSETKPGITFQENTSFSTKQLNSSIVKGTNSIAELIYGTPQKTAWAHDMKENASTIKTVQTTMMKTITKRRALEDIQRKA